MKRQLAGQVFGRLTVLQAAPSRRGVAYWQCRCSCGSEKQVRAGHLTAGLIRSCGCLSKESKSSRWDARREEADSISERQCSDCRKILPLGSFRKVPHLLLGVSHRCRACCIAKERLSRPTKRPRELAPTTKLVPGQRFGRLIVQDREPIRTDNSSGYSWWCKCSCGQEKQVNIGHLARKKQPTLSCGCLARERSRERLTKWKAGCAEKLCSRCKRELPLGRFRIAAGMASGRSSICKPCSSELHSAWSKRQTQELTDRYVSLTLRLPQSICTSELIQHKREQITLRRLALELKQAITEKENEIGT